MGVRTGQRYYLSMCHPAVVIARVMVMHDGELSA